MLITVIAAVLVLFVGYMNLHWRVDKLFKIKDEEDKRRKEQEWWDAHKRNKRIHRFNKKTAEKNGHIK